MSLVFDALQRAESERHGVDLPKVLSAVELMQLAERESMMSEGDLAKVTERPEAVSLSPEDNHVDPFSQFQPLEVSVPLRSRLICLADNDSLAAERFRHLGVRLQQIRRGRQLKSLLITSTIPKEGKSMVAANLACTLAQRPQQRVLLLDGDLRRSTVAAAFGLGSIPGIYEWLQNKRDLMMSIYRLEGAGIWIMPAGDVGRNPLELLQSGRLPALIEQLASWFDWIIIDSPPLLPLADTIVWTRLADGVLLVARKGTTEKRLLKKGLEELDKKKLIGAVLNCLENPRHYEHYYHYQSSSTSRPDSSHEKI